MKKILIFALLSLSATVFAQGRPSLKTYDCKMSYGSCNYGNISRVEITAYSGIMAKNKCQSLSQRKGMRYCGVDSYTSNYPSYETRAFNCQLAKKFCGYNGGRYTFTIYANSFYSAENKCRNKAYNRYEHFCRVTNAGVGAGGTYGTRNFTCYIDSGRRASCSRPTAFNIRAMGYDDARRKCNNKARNMRRRLCRVTAR